MRSRSPLLRLLAAALLIGLLALALPATGAAEKQAGHSVGVYAGAKKVASFSQASCKINKEGFSLLAHDKGWTIYAQASPFDDFHHYDFPRGHATGNYVELASPAHVHFASDFKPPHPVPAAGGLNFSEEGDLVGVGFQPTFSVDGSEAVTITGVLTCVYPQPKS